LSEELRSLLLNTDSQSVSGSTAEIPIIVT